MRPLASFLRAGGGCVSGVDLAAEPLAAKNCARDQAHGPVFGAMAIEVGIARAENDTEWAARRPQDVYKARRPRWMLWRLTGRWTRKGGHAAVSPPIATPDAAAARTALAAHSHLGPRIFPYRQLEYASGLPARPPIGPRLEGCPGGRGGSGSGHRAVWLLAIACAQLFSRSRQASYAQDCRRWCR